MRDFKGYGIFLLAVCLSSCKLDNSFSDTTLSTITIDTTCNDGTDSGSSDVCTTFTNGKPVIARILNDACSNADSATVLATSSTTADCQDNGGSQQCTASNAGFASVPAGATTISGGNYCIDVFFDISGSGQPATGDARCQYDYTFSGDQTVALPVTSCFTM